MNHQDADAMREAHRQEIEAYKATSGHYTFSDLRKLRGWSERLIRELLGEPDELKRNPMSSSRRAGVGSAYAPMKLYTAERVHAAEQDARYIAYQARRQKQSTASKATADRKAAELESWASSVPIVVQRLSLNTVHKRSLESREAWEASRGRFGFDGASVDDTTRERWAVNFVRHELTTYDDSLLQAYGKVGVDSAAAIIRDRVLSEIARVYPELAAECERQRR